MSMLATCNLTASYQNSTVRILPTQYHLTNPTHRHGHLPREQGACGEVVVGRRTQATVLQRRSAVATVGERQSQYAVELTLLGWCRKASRAPSWPSRAKLSHIKLLLVGIGQTPKNLRIFAFSSFAV